MASAPGRVEKRWASAGRQPAGGAAALQIAREAGHLDLVAETLLDPDQHRLALERLARPLRGAQADRRHDIGMQSRAGSHQRPAFRIAPD